MKEISLFVPIYNGEKSLKNLKKIHSFLCERFDSFELFFVNDSSTDNTEKLLEELRLNNSSVLNFRNGPSRRENLGLAMQNAKYSITGFIDLDLSADISYIKDLFQEIYCGQADIAIGSRYKGINPQRNLFRKVISLIYNLFMSLYFRSNISDHQCGLKVFRTDLLMLLLTELKYDYSFRRGWFWDAELLIRAQRKQLRISEVPVEWQEGEKSTFRLLRELKMIPYVLALRFRLQ